MASTLTRKKQIDLFLMQFGAYKTMRKVSGAQSDGIALNSGLAIS